MNRPFRLPILRACAVLLLALAALCPGQNAAAPEPPSRDSAKPLSARDPLPELPVSGLLDEGNVFREETAALAGGDLEDFRKRVGLPLFVVTANYIFGDSVENYCERLVKEKLQGRSGVVMLYERGSGQLQYCASPGALGRVEDMRVLFLISSKAAAFLPDEATPAERLRAAVQGLTTAAEHWKKTGELPPPPAVPAPAPPAPPEKKDHLPAAPLDFLLDQADAFDAEAKTALKTELMKFHAEHDMDVYIITNLYLPERTAQTLAEKLSEKWLLDRLGAVLVMNRGTGAGEEALGIALSLNSERIVAGNILAGALTEARAKSEEVRNRPDGSRPAGLHAAAQVLMATLAKHGDRTRATQAQTISPGQWSVMTGVAAALLLGAVLLFGFHRVQERLERRSNEQFRFPDVTVGRRLGAVQGGGNVAGITLGRKPPR